MYVIYFFVPIVLDSGAIAISRVSDSDQGANALFTSECAMYVMLTALFCFSSAHRQAEYTSHGRVWRQGK